MSGIPDNSSNRQMGALTGWVEKIPAPPAPTWVDKDASVGVSRRSCELS